MSDNVMDGYADGFVKIPRACFDRYWPLPWGELVSLAERGVDGLEVRGPYATPQLNHAPRQQDYQEQEMYEAAVRNYEADCDVAFMRRGDPFWFGDDRAILFQQNW